LDKDKLIEFTEDYLTSRNLTVSPSTENVITSSKYLNTALLDSMNRDDLKNNLAILLDEAIENHKVRTSSAKRPTKVRDVDVRPVLKRRFCNLPPFCECDEQWG